MKIIKGNWNEKDVEVMAAQYEPFIFINQNGSKWAGQEQDDISELLNALEAYALDSKYEEYGNFITVNPCAGIENPEWNWSNGKTKYIDGPRLFDVDGVVMFNGNFLELSHGFCIYTNDQETINTLTKAIMDNQRRPDYGFITTKIK